MEYSTIRINFEIRERLKNLGKKSESYDDVLLRILNHTETCERFWVDGN